MCVCVCVALPLSRPLWKNEVPVQRSQEDDKPDRTSRPPPGHNSTGDSPPDDPEKGSSPCQPSHTHPTTPTLRNSTEPRGRKVRGECAMLVSRKWEGSTDSSSPRPSLTRSAVSAGNGSLCDMCDGVMCDMCECGALPVCCN